MNVFKSLKDVHLRQQSHLVKTSQPPHALGTVTAMSATIMMTTACRALAVNQAPCTCGLPRTPLWSWHATSVSQTRTLRQRVAPGPRSARFTSVCGLLSAHPLSACLSPEESAKVSFPMARPGVALVLHPQGVMDQERPGALRVRAPWWVTPGFEPEFWRSHVCNPGSDTQLPGPGGNYHLVGLLSVINEINNNCVWHTVDMKLFLFTWLVTCCRVLPSSRTGRREHGRARSVATLPSVAFEVCCAGHLPSSEWCGSLGERPGPGGPPRGRRSQSWGGARPRMHRKFLTAGPSFRPLSGGEQEAG